jgi:hypothetical protein
MVADRFFHGWMTANLENTLHSDISQKPFMFFETGYFSLNCHPSRKKNDRRPSAFSSIILSFYMLQK